MKNSTYRVVKLLALSIITALFIYYRKLDYYSTIPRHSIMTSIAVAIWTFVTLQEPYFLVIGLVLLNVFGIKHE